MLNLVRGDPEWFYERRGVFCVRLLDSLILLAKDQSVEWTREFLTHLASAIMSVEGDARLCVNLFTLMIRVVNFKTPWGKYEVTG